MPDYTNSFDEKVFYKIAAATDVAETWKRFGWSPPSLDPEIQEKWIKAQERTRIGDWKS
jgi:hypothetical protein